MKITKDVEHILNQISGNTRFVWNKMLFIQQYRMENKYKLLTYTEMSATLTFWRTTEELSFLKTSSFDSQQQKLRDLNRAIWDGLSKESNKKFPVFKKKNYDCSFRCSGNKQFSLDMSNSKVRIPTIGWLKFRKSREIIGTPKNVTVIRNAGKWYISIQTEYEVEDPIHSSDKVVGIDMGITKFATLSDGTVINPLNSFIKHENKLKVEQRKLDNKIKFSSNWKKQNIKVNKIHTKIANVRRDFLHKRSTVIANENKVAVVEDLEITKMTKSAKGNKSNLNKRILDQGWGTFRLLLSYKLKDRGGVLIKVDPKYTSQKCSICGYTVPENRVTQSQFKCIQCGSSFNADYNAACNILAAGQAVIACGTSSQESVCFS